VKRRSTELMSGTREGALKGWHGSNETIEAEATLIAVHSSWVRGEYMIRVRSTEGKYVWKQMVSIKFLKRTRGGDETLAEFKDRVFAEAAKIAIEKAFETWGF
jgi:hypothetical protein